jgi:hypothetical protein
MRNRPISDAARRSAYQEMLDTELGRNRRMQGHRDNGRPDGTLALITRPAGLIILGILFFALTFTVLLWRDGAFDKWLEARGATIGASSKSWILGRNVRERLEDTSTPPEDVAAEEMQEAAPQSATPTPAAPAPNAPAPATEAPAAAPVEPTSEAEPAV